MPNRFNVVGVLRFLRDAGLVSAGYTLALHGWAWALLPLAFTAACRVAAEDALRADLRRQALALADLDDIARGGGSDG